MYNENMEAVVTPVPAEVNFGERLAGFVESLEEKMSLSEGERGKLAGEVADLGEKVGKKWQETTFRFVTGMSIEMDGKYPGYSYNMLKMVVEETKTRLEKNGVKNQEPR